MPFAHSPRLSRFAMLFTGLLAATPLLARADSYRIVANIEGSVTALSANGQAAAGMTLKVLRAQVSHSAHRLETSGTQLQRCARAVVTR